MNYNWNDHRHLRFADVENIVSRCLLLNLDDLTGREEEEGTIKAKIKAHGDNFTETLIEYTEARYPSGHSMRFTILKSVFRMLDINKKRNT